MNRKRTTLGAITVTALAAHLGCGPSDIYKAPAPEEKLTISPEDFAKAMAQGSSSKEQFLVVFRTDKENRTQGEIDRNGDVNNPLNPDAVQATVMRPGMAAGFTANKITTSNGWTSSLVGTPTVLQIATETGDLAGAMGHRDDPYGVLAANIRYALAEQGLDRSLVDEKMRFIHDEVDKSIYGNLTSTMKQEVSPRAARAERRKVNQHQQDVHNRSTMERTRGQRAK